MKYSQLPTNEMIKLKLMADKFEQIRYQQVQNEKRQQNEFLALKVRHAIKVDDRRAVVHEKFSKENATIY